MKHLKRLIDGGIIILSVASVVALVTAPLYYWPMPSIIIIFIGLSYLVGCLYG